MRQLALGHTELDSTVSILLANFRLAFNVEHSLMLPDLTPNPGLWWYFFTEMFDHFRPFFLMVFSVRLRIRYILCLAKSYLWQVHLLIYVVPMCIKFQWVFTHCVQSLISTRFLGMICCTRASFCSECLPPSRRIPRSPSRGSF